MTMTPEAALALRKPFPPESVGKLPKPVKRDDPDKGKCEQGSRYSADGHYCGGYHSRSMHLDFAGHAAVTDRLLTVDPEWTWEPLALDPTGLPAFDRNGNLWIRLTICGTTRLGVGDGKSIKECIGDAIRNAAMRFGVALDLWAKENLVEFATAAMEHQRQQPQSLADVIPPSVDPATGEVTEPGVTPAQIRKLGVLMHGQSRDEALAAVAAIIGRPVASRNELTKSEAGRVIDALESPADTEGAPA